jgi:hypothetical protein
VTVIVGFTTGAGNGSPIRATMLAASSISTGSAIFAAR